MACGEMRLVLAEWLCAFGLKKEGGKDAGKARWMACDLGPLWNERPLLVRVSERAIRCDDGGSARARTLLVMGTRVGNASLPG